MWPNGKDRNKKNSEYKKKEKKQKQSKLILKCVEKYVINKFISCKIK